MTAAVLMDSEGWEARVTVFHNGRRVGTADVLADSFDDLPWAVECRIGEGLDCVTRYGRKALDAEVPS